MSMEVKEFVLWLGILGIPSIFAMTMWCIRACIRFTKQLGVLMEAQQAQMRSLLIAQYKDFIKQGWIEVDDLDAWENQYQKYHVLGVNGVLDQKRQQLLTLPNTPPHN